MVVGRIYKITNLINGKIYIGQTTKSIDKRFKQHCERRKSLISLSIKKYNKHNFTIEEIYCSFDRQDLDIAEQLNILYYNTISPLGYNLTSGGNSKKQYSLETRKKLSFAKKNKKCIKQSIAMLGKKQSHKTRKLKAKLLGINTFLVIDKNTNIIINKYDCIGICAEELKLDPTRISNCLKNKRKSHKGLLFKFEV